MSAYPYVVQIASCSHDHFCEINVWLAEHIGSFVDDWLYMLDGQFGFKDADQAMLFKLTWGGK